MLEPLKRSVTNFGRHVQKISNSVVLVTSRIINVEQIVSTLPPRWLQNQLESYFIQEPNVRISWKNSKRKSSSLRSTVFFCNATSAMLVRQSTSPEWRGIGRLFAPLWEVLAAKLRENFPREGTESTYVVPTIGFLAPVLNVYDRRHGIGIPVFRSSPVGDDHVYCISLGVSLCALVCPSTFCNKLLVKRVFRPKIPCSVGDGRSSASSLSRRMASLGDLSFCGALLLWPLQAAIYLFFHKVKYRTFTCDTTGKPVKLSVTDHTAPHPVSLIP